MNHYKSWSDLNSRLQALLCPELQRRITYFVTSYRKVHNSYGRAAVRLDGRDLAVFSWANGIRQDADLYRRWKETGEWDPDATGLRAEWAENAVLTDRDFLEAATGFLQLPIEDALTHENPLIRMLAILDRRIGARTLEHLREENLPDWLARFVTLRTDGAVPSDPTTELTHQEETTHEL